MKHKQGRAQETTETEHMTIFNTDMDLHTHTQTTILKKYKICETTEFDENKVNQLIKQIQNKLLCTYKLSEFLSGL